MDRRFQIKLGAALGCSVFVGLAQAQNINVVNFGFEANIAPPRGFAVTIPTGWSLHDPAGIVDQIVDAVGAVNPTGTTFYPGGAPEGVNVALLYLAGDRGGGEVGFRQTVNASLTANTRYTLRIEVGNIASGFGAPGNTFYNLDGFPGYRIDLFAGNTLIARDLNSLAPSIPEGQFRTSTLSVDIRPGHPALGLPLEIWVVNLNTLGTPMAPGIEVNFDNVRLAAEAIPPLCPGDLTGEGDVDFADFLLFFNCFDQDLPCADINGEPGVDFGDFLAFFNAYDAGC